VVVTRDPVLRSCPPILSPRVYVCDRLVLRDLTETQLGEIAPGRLSMDSLVRAYIRERLAYSFVVTEISKEAHDLERAVRAGGLDGAKPTLSPLPTGEAR